MIARQRLLLAVCCLPLVASCVTLKPLRTPSGNPEVVVRSAGRVELLEALRAELLGREYELVMSNERLVMFSKPVDDFDTAFFYGEGWNASADFRVTCFVREDPYGMQLVADLEIVTNAGTPDEAFAPAPKGHPEAHDLQDIFENLQADMALKRHEEAWPDQPARPSEPTIWTGDDAG